MKRFARLRASDIAAWARLLAAVLRQRDPDGGGEGRAGTPTAGAARRLADGEGPLAERGAEPVAGMRRALSVAALGATLLACLGSAAIVAATAPVDRHDRIAGIAIGSPGAYARIPRRGLACTVRSSGAVRESCRVAIDGRTLTVEVEHHPRPSFEFRACAASYDARTAPCRAGNFTLAPGGMPRYALIPATQLGVPEQALPAARRQHRLENLSEADWLALARRLATVPGLGVALTVLPLPRGRWYLRTVAAAIAGLAAYFLSHGVLLVLLSATARLD